MTWKSCPETTIECKSGDTLKVTWGDDITVCVEATYSDGSSESSESFVHIDLAALPHLVLALQHCMDVARLEGCYEEQG